MGIETLNSAARAAGFAMAAPEEAYEDLEALPHTGVAPPERSSRLTELHWQPNRGVLLHEKPAERGDWMGVLLSFFGRRTAPRRPALTAEA
jgi:hypothetical protein